jgi:hypothetical protein
MSEGTDEPVMVPVTVTCHTDGCSNAGHAIPLLVPEGGAVVCGVCGEPITDQTATQEEES